MRDTTLLQEFLMVPEFEDLPEEHLAWLANNARDRRFQPGEVLMREGDPAEAMFVLVEGEVRYRKESAGPASPVYISRAPEIGGALPLSRMKQAGVDAIAITESRVAVMATSLFPEMLARMPQLNQRLASVMADRIREVAILQQQYEKLMALGRLAGGLAHELNNPASAAMRAARKVSDAVLEVRQSAVRLGELEFPDFAWKLLFDYEQAAIQRAQTDTDSSIERSDKEERIAVWFGAHGVADGWKIASALADAGLDVPDLDSLAAKAPAKFLAEVLIHMCSVLTAERLLSEVHNSLGRISQLVNTLRDYSFLDQQPVQEVDIHDGLESTLAMLHYRMGDGIRVTRTYDRDLPRICAHASALNQVWTHLIENALDAMGTKGELRVRTACEVDCALIEVGDNGPGVPPEIQGRIFEPFYSTKQVGKGVGLGLDLARRLLWNHNGSIAFESRPGDTRFQVRLPFNQIGLAVHA